MTLVREPIAVDYSAVVEVLRDVAPDWLPVRVLATETGKSTDAVRTALYAAGADGLVERCEAAGKRTGQAQSHWRAR